MNEVYRKLMLQQELSGEANTAFMNKMKQCKPKKRATLVLRAAVLAICVLLLIPATVFAVETVFGIAIIKRDEHATLLDKPGIGLEIRFKNVKNHSIKEFSEHLQSIDGRSAVYYDSWEAAENDVGIDLIYNSVIDGEKTMPVNYQIIPGDTTWKHCGAVYSGAKDQLYYARICAAYEKNHVKFLVSAEITAEHPAVTDAQLEQFHGYNISYFKDDDSNVVTKQYTTKNGIPVTVCEVHLGDLTEYNGYFAVDDVSYELRIVGCEGSWTDEHVGTVFTEVLEGFSIS